MVDSSPFCTTIWGRILLVLVPGFEGSRREWILKKCIIYHGVSENFALHQLFISKGIYIDIPNKYPPYKVYMGLIIMYRYHPNNTDSKIKSLAPNEMGSFRHHFNLHFTPETGVIQLYTHFGGIKQRKCMGSFQGFPL